MTTVPPAELDTQELRYCLGRFATGVTLVSYQSPAGPSGLTVNSFTSVSLDPPLVLVGIARAARAAAHLVEASFTVNVLRSRHRALALQFARRAQGPLPIRWTSGVLAPRLTDSLAWIECAPWRSYDGGDHMLLVGRVERFGYFAGEALVFMGGRFSSLPVVAEPPAGRADETYWGALEYW